MQLTSLFECSIVRLNMRSKCDNHRPGLGRPGVFINYFIDKTTNTPAIQTQGKPDVTKQHISKFNPGLNRKPFGRNKKFLMTWLLPDHEDYSSQYLVLLIIDMALQFLWPVAMTVNVKYSGNERNRSHCGFSL